MIRSRALPGHVDIVLQATSQVTLSASTESILRLSCGPRKAKPHARLIRYSWTQQSPERWPRAFVCSAVVPSRGGRAQLCGRLIVFRSEGLWLWGGAAGAGTWGQLSIGMFRSVRGTSGDAVDGVCPLQEMTRQDHQRSVESVGAGAGSSARTSLLLRGGWLPSMEPPNPVAAAMVPAAGASKGCSTSGTGLH